MNIKILGTSCPKCKTLEKLTLEVIQDNEIDAEISKVEDIVQIMNYGIINTPGLVIDEKVMVSGRLPAKSEIELFIQMQQNA